MKLTLFEGRKTEVTRAWLHIPSSFLKPHFSVTDALLLTFPFWSFSITVRTRGLCLQFWWQSHSFLLNIRPAPGRTKPAVQQTGRSPGPWIAQPGKFTLRKKKTNKLFLKSPTDKSSVLYYISEWPELWRVSGKKIRLWFPLLRRLHGWAFIYIRTPITWYFHVANGQFNRWIKSAVKSSGVFYTQSNLGSQNTSKQLSVENFNPSECRKWEKLKREGRLGWPQLASSQLAVPSNSEAVSTVQSCDNWAIFAQTPSGRAVKLQQHKLALAVLPHGGKVNPLHPNATVRKFISGYFENLYFAALRAIRIGSCDNVLQAMKISGGKTKDKLGIQILLKMQVFRAGKKFPSNDLQSLGEICMHSHLHFP